MGLGGRLPPAGAAATSVSRTLAPLPSACLAPVAYSALLPRACSISVTFKDEKDGTEKTVQVPMGKSLLEAAHENEIELEGACEGSLACSTCHVIVEDQVGCRRCRGGPGRPRTAGRALPVQDRCRAYAPAPPRLPARLPTSLPAGVLRQAAGAG